MTPASPGAPHGPWATLREAVELLQALRQAGGRRFWVTVAGLALASLTEGLSMILLLPILQIAQGESGAATGLGGLAGLPLPGALGSLEVLLLAFVALMAATAALNRWRLLLLGRLVFDAVSLVRRRLFEAVSEARWDALVRIRRAEIEHHLMTEGDRLNLSFGIVFNMLQSVAALALFLVVAALASPAMLLVAAAVGLIAAAILWPFRGRAGLSGARIVASRARQQAVVSSFLSGLKAARAMGLEGTQQAAFAEALARTRAEILELGRVGSLSGTLLQVAFSAAAAAFVWASVRVAQMDFATIVLFLVLLVRLAPRVAALQGMVQQLAAESGSFRAVRAFEARLRAARDPAAGSTAAALAAAREAIRLEGVTVWLGDADEGARPAIDDVTLEVPAGRITALVGPSGSGKTTIADVVLGLLAPARGRVLIDGRALEPAQAGAWRRGVAYVPQDPVLIRDTLRQNLLDAAPGASAEDLRRALDLAEASALADRPGGLDAPVGERGALLSGGERQRVALAQAFLRRPHLLILDEATSGLDWRTQDRVASAVAGLAGPMTVLLIAHRPEAIRHADLVHVIADGRVAESGRPADLARRKGSFVGGMLAGAGA